MLGFSVLFMGVLVAATTVITDRGITFDEGNIIDLQEINLTGIPLLISDNTNNKIIAIFNDDITDIETRALSQSSTLFGGTVTSFFGDVNNFDNVNDFSRFKEVNLNNGVNASAGFVGENNIGHSVSLGLGSSNFKLANTDTPNLGLIFLSSPSDFAFVNDFSTGWQWINDEGNSTGTPIEVTQMELDHKGNLEIKGNFTGDLIQLRNFEPKHTCNMTTTGQIVYEANGSMGDFFGCKQQNINTFVWTKF